MSTLKLFLALLFLSSCATETSIKSDISPGFITQESKGRFKLVGLEDLKDEVQNAEIFFKKITLEDDLFMTKFQNTHLAGDNIAATILASPDYTVKVSTYGWAKDRFSAAIAYYTKSEGIKLNRYKLKRNPCSIVGTLVHEYMHHLGFSHGDNYAKGKEFSVPYWMGNKAVKMCKEGRL
jgi:hypothetical protein